MSMSDTFRKLRRHDQCPVCCDGSRTVLYLAPALREFTCAVLGQRGSELLHTDAELVSLQLLDTMAAKLAANMAALEDIVAVPRLWVTPEPTVDMSRFPHRCPRCSKPAYIGATLVECSDGSCS